ncbi:MAG TPA: hypothetical protein VLD39_16480 [Gammaproteobacteria bacterium]|nr:hypothetical protein [Gammaproteobacteria bacterium]
MRNRRREQPLTLLDLITTVSRLARSDQEAAAVINHLLQTSRIRFANGLPGRELERLIA